MMPATVSELPSVEGSHALEDVDRSSANVPSLAPPATVPSSPPLLPTTTRPTVTSETIIMTKVVSMANNDCSSALSSPAEASPAKPAGTSPTAFDGSVETSPATSHIASASDSLKRMGTGHVNISESSSSLPALPTTTFGSPELETDFPAVLTFKGVSVTLENNSVWKQFYSCGTEMILTKQGRRMFPYCRYRLTGLDPERQYSLVLSIVPSDKYRYRWSTTKWEVTGAAEHQAQGLIRASSHHYSPCRGSEWMSGLVSFYKLKLTNNPQDQEGHIILHSMHRYIPRLHVIPVPDGDLPTPEQPMVMGPESMTFTFPQTEFMAVTTYQNFRITQLKINHNPFAKGFREDGNNSRLNRLTTETQPVLKTDTQPAVLEPAKLSDNENEAVDLSMKNHTVSASPSNEKETRLVLKPIMSTSASKGDPYVPCIRGKHALGELVLVQKHPLLEPKEETHATSVTPEEQKNLRVTPLATSSAPTSTMSTQGRSPGYRKRKKRINRRWANSRGREWKTVAASPTVVHSPSLTVAMQPELDDVEGLLFVSFTSKEALEVHVKDKPANGSLSASPVHQTTLMKLKQEVEVSLETDEEKISRFEAILLQDLQVLKHRQVIHPVLQEVGLKLSSLDPAMSIDLRYLGINLPLPPPNPPEQGNAAFQSPGDEGLPFISRTGKTSDMTKIKGWKNKFIKSKETPLVKSDGSPKNLSAFCSHMLDEYLESEAQCISERAAAFSTTPEGSVAYQLPAKSSSYVKTLDSVLKHQNAVSSSPAGTNRPCPLSHKPLLYSALMSPAPPLASPATPAQAAAQFIRQSAQPVAVSTASTGSVSQRLSAHHPGVSQRPVVSFGQRRGMTNKPSGFTKFQFKLFQMEIGAFNQGLSRTQLTPDRLSVALSTMLTKQMMPSQVLNVAQSPKYEAQQPECAQEFCRLGCVCNSLRQMNRGPLHCRRPECMFGCACFKRKITKHLSGMASEQQNQPVYSMTNMEHAVQPHPGSRINKLWNRSVHDVDPDPVFVPTSAPLCLAPLKVIKRSSGPRPMQPIQEEDKDPVYRYLESMMTCARVREFNSKPPPEVSIELQIPGVSTPNATAALRKTTADAQLRNCHRTILTQKPAEKTQEATSSDIATRKQIEIQSVCPWNNDRQMVLEALCQRMNQNRLSRRFSVGPYCVHPVAKVVMRKPSGSIITYRVRISKPAKASDNDEEEFDDSDDEGHASGSLDEDVDAEEEDGEIEPEVQCGVTPFLSAVLPAGRLRARTKPAGCQAYGLIQVNGKSYNQARLLLGNMGSLHPANRVAAFVTGRLHGLANVSCSNSQKSDPTDKISTPGTLHIKAARTVYPPIRTAGKTADLKTPTPPPAQLSQPDSWREGSITLLQPSQIFPATNPVHTAGQRSSVGAFQSSSMTSPVSLTVSPSLKTPSFLGQSGTYSFRICPPTNQGTKGRDLPGVTLPGGFTLIQLPKPGTAGAAGAESVDATNTAGADKAPTTKSGDSGAVDSDAKWLGLHTFTGAKTLSNHRAVKPEVMCDERMPSEESNGRQVESNVDFVSDDLSSDSSDYCGECDEDEEVVDIETIEEVRQGMAIAKMKEAVSKALRESRPQEIGKFFSTFRESCEFGLKTQKKMYNEHPESKAVRRRKNHSVLERQRRSEQRDLFDKLQTVLKSDPRAPRLRLLSLALKEIQNLVDTSKYLEEKKRRLTQMQSVYLKELSRLSGKSSNLIKHKLKEICERQKMRERTMKWRPFFSHLLQSRAAVLQATTPQCKRHSPPLLQPDFLMAPSHSDTHTTPEPHSHSVPQPASSAAHAEATAASPQASNLPGEPAASVHGGQQQPTFESQQGSVPTSQSECQPQAPTVAAPPQDGASPVPSAPHPTNPPGAPPQPFALPLIRSKTGRIILPSSLKPTGQGFFTLMLMKANQKGEQDGVSVQPSNGSSSKNQEKSLSESDLPLDSESSGTLEGTASKSPNSGPASGGTAPSGCSLLNRPNSVPSVTGAVEKSTDGGAAAALNNTGSSACLSFNHTHQSATSVQPKAKPRPAVGRCRRGRPRKSPASPDSDGEQRAVLEDSSLSVSESETSLLADERRSEKTTLEETKAQFGDFEGTVSDGLVPVKRPRGRPPKMKPTQLWRPRAALAGSGPVKSNEDKPVTPPHSLRSSDLGPKQRRGTATLTGAISTSRPLTRGALGKDFPSAKKRSWIDVEKELEPEVDSE